MVNFKQFYKSLLFGFILFGIKSSLMAQESPSVGAWSVSKEAATTFENQDPVALAHKIHNYQQRILTFAETQGKVSELDELRNSYFKKQDKLFVKNTKKLMRHQIQVIRLLY